MLRVLSRLAVVLVSVASVAAPAFAESVRGVLLGDPLISLAADARDGSTIALVGSKRLSENDFTPYMFMAAFSDQTGKELWRHEGNVGQLAFVAMAQNRICVAGYIGMPNSVIALGCYAASDGAELWYTEFTNEPWPATQYDLTIASLSLTGKGLLLRTGSAGLPGAISAAILLDPVDGSAK